MANFTVTFYPDDVAIQVPEGTTVFQAATTAGIEIKSTCGNEGTCGRCAIKVKEGKVKTREGNVSARLRRSGLVLACQTLVQGNVVVEIPKDSRLDEHKVLLENNLERHVLSEKQLDLLGGYEFAPLCRQVYVELESPSIGESASDWSRLRTELKKRITCQELVVGLNKLRELAETLRQGDWRVTVTVAQLDGRAEVVGLEPGHPQRQAYGLAVDIGTTTVVVYLVDLATGAVVERAGTYNKQARYGDDVISRMIYATNEKDGLERLHQAVINTINQLTERVLERSGVDKNNVHSVVAAGNTTMTHLFLRLPPKHIRLDPYIPTATDFPPVKAGELGIKINPDAWVMSFPCVASYVGGDIVAGVLATRVSHQDGLVLFIDIGTNGEMVLGNRDWLISCACSAGPAFEGAGITFGMRAMNGAVERVEIDPHSFEVSVKTIGSYKPIGLCGSGLIDCLAKMRRVGLIDRTGKFQVEGVETPRLRKTDEDVEFVLVRGQETECGKDIVLTESDIKTLMRSKGAVYAGIQSLLKAVELKLDAIDKIIIAGGFGNYLNVADAVEIGLLPDINPERYEFAGNTSVKGAQMTLLSHQAFQEAKEIGQKLTYIELSAGTTFMEEFVSAIFLPHTDLNQFPSVVN